MTDKKELKEEQLQKVNGGDGVVINNLSKLSIGDIVTIDDNFGKDTYCYVKKMPTGSYKFLKYEKGAKWVEDGRFFSSIPSGATITKIGHDDQFVSDNVICGM